MTDNGRRRPGDIAAARRVRADIERAGPYAGTRIVDRLPERASVTVIEGVLIVAGLIFLIGG